MKRNAYKFTKGAYGNKFIFTSSGTKGSVRKGVIFKDEDDDVYSISMGDLDAHDQIQNFDPTGNNDARKVMATCADIIDYFLEQKPKATIFISGATDRLTKLYKMLILRELTPGAGYMAFGLNADSTYEPLDPNKEYEGYFVLRRK
ncbi:DUF6934 family protein [Flavisolibacter nicotianae]|uniref:DUF6934 family protein n=1 Tax=Flavisolibacter nicotianae TaxID=2364882 RepID=UPI000EAD7C42|nr:hypothetical protein [Flavisolibacter nicotianae]